MKNQYKPFNSFLVRTPALPFNYSDILNPEYSSSLFFQEAIFNTSFDLYNEMLKYFNNILEEKDRKKIEVSLFKYWKRIRTRTTPYGLFSAISSGNICKSETEVLFNENFEKNIRLDMEVLCSLINTLEQNEEIKGKIYYYSNDTVYKVGNKLRYYENRFVEDRLFKYSISSVAYSSFIKEVLEYGKNGCSIIDYISFIKKRNSEISNEEAEDFVMQLISSKLLISELQPCVTDGDVLTNIIKKLSLRNVKTSILKEISVINDKLGNLKFNETNDINFYKNIIHILDNINFQYPKKNIFQIDLLKKTKKSNLDEKIPENILSAISFIRKTQYDKRKNENIENFKRIFTEKYEDREMNLLFVTDSNVGIGYPATYSDDTYTNDLIKNLQLPVKKNQEKRVVWNKAQELLLKKIIQSNKNDLQEIILNDDDIDDKNGNDINMELHPTFYCNFEIIDNSGDDPMIKLNSFGGFSGANLLARFSHLDKEILELIKDITNKEQELNNLKVVELSHLPNSRIGNVITREKLRDFELTILSNSSLAQEKKIPISDLTISIRNNKIIIKSKKLKQEIKVLHTNAFNHNLSTVPAFGLLCDLQDDSNYLETFILHPNVSLSFIPRIRYKNVILSPAKWLFHKRDFEKLIKTESIEGFKHWQMENNLPNHILFSEGDNELYLNLDNKKCIESLMEIMKKNEFIILKELLYNENCDVIKDMKGNNYRGEFSIAYHKI